MTALALLLASTARAQDDDFMPVPLAPAPAKSKPAKAKPSKAKPAKARPAAEAADKDADALLPLVPLTPKSLADKVVLRGPMTELQPNESTTINIKVVDAAGKPTAGELELKADVGTITTAVEVSAGHYIATYAAPGETPRSGTATVTVQVRNAARPVAADIILAVSGRAPPPVARETPEPEKKPTRRAARVIFDGPVEVGAGESATLAFRVVDDRGRSVAPSALELRSDSGEISNVRERDGGGYVADFKPADGRHGELLVYAQDRGEPLSGTGTVVVQQRAATSGGESAFGLGVFAGGLTNFGELFSPHVELSGELRFGRVRAGLLAGIAPGSANEVLDRSGNARASFALMQIPMMVRLTAVLSSAGALDIYAGGMGGAALVRGTVTQGTNSASINRTSLAGALLGGFALRLGPGAALFELRVSSIPFDYEDPNGTFAVRNSNLGGLSGALGYRLDI